MAEQAHALALREPDIVALQEVTARSWPLWRAALGHSIDAAALDEFLGALDPAISVQLYRQFQLREAPALAGEVRGRRIELPVRCLFGRHDVAQDYRQLRGLREHAPDSAVELVDASHWIVDERPDLVADRARALFS